MSILFPPSPKFLFKSFPLLLATVLSGAAFIVEDYEGLAAGSPEPHFTGAEGNFGTAFMQVVAETPGSEVFGAGNQRYLDWESLAGINPDSTGFDGGPSDFLAFPNGAADVVTAGFDFVIESLQSELLFGIGEPQKNREDDQHFGVLVRLRGPLGLSNKPEIFTTGTSQEVVDLQEGVPYRIEIVANQSGGPVTYQSALGEMTVGHEKYDIFLHNLRDNVFQLALDESDWKIDDNAAPGDPTIKMEGVFWGTYRYDATGRAIDFKMDDVAIYTNEITLTGYDTIKPGGVTAYVDYEERTTATDAVDPLWALPGDLVADTAGVFGAANAVYFDTNGRQPQDGISDRFRFPRDLDLLSFGFDVYVDRDPTVSSFTDGHDELFFVVSGGDTISNAEFTTRVNIRGTRSVGGSGNPADAEPMINVVGPGTSSSLNQGFDWQTPYRIQVVLNQSGASMSYNTPWGANVALPNETIHLYLYNYTTGQNVADERAFDTPYVLESSFLNGKSNASGVRGTIRDILWKQVTGRRNDLRLDNFAIFEDALVVIDPDPAPIVSLPVTAVAFERGPTSVYQAETPSIMRISFASEPFTNYTLQVGFDLSDFTDVRTLIPGIGGEQELEVFLEEIPLFLRLGTVLR